MAKIIALILLLVELIFSGQRITLKSCNSCHQFNAPPLTMIYRRYLMLYSSKNIIKRRMVDFLLLPSDDKSSIPIGLKRRFKPSKHPKFDLDTASRCVEELIKSEDLIPKIKVR